ncbi:TIGR00159 family protein [Cyanobacterium stanieri LEGE 03274]|uniref:Diadenylate cyclase n=1 Tax=Cyanobacterium stanieri LEGE 03274 TaxID=1828756 RepID=A0ABR9V4A6_9CHRO|nr:diadenylate cyclase CdaA [Cyanobacterium stanieri]MBE9222735.1 TIGR00159 family protein [Cyanobacterium stanieri LEGE 03274]
MFWSGFFPDNLKFFLLFFLDLGLVSVFFYLIISLVKERRAQRMVRGLLFLILIYLTCDRLLQLTIISFFLEQLILICSLSMGVVFQSDFRRFLEQLGKGEIKLLWQSDNIIPKGDTIIDEIVEAVKELSQNRTGALIIIETFNTVEERVFLSPGVQLNAEITKELLQTIFQTKTLLHDGAVFIRGSEIVSASVILPLSEKSASKRLGTRHRAAMGITELVENCVCVVVSEETGSISLGEKGVLNRPLTSTKLKELLEEKLNVNQDAEVVTGVTRISRQLGFRSWSLITGLFKSKKASAKDNYYNQLPKPKDK